MRRPAALIYCSAMHLFVSSGLYYAACLAKTHDVHVLLQRSERGALGPSEEAALADLGVELHWTDRGLSPGWQRRARRLARDLVSGIAPEFVLTLDDIDIFACHLGRAAAAVGVPLVCFQSGAYLRSDFTAQRAEERALGVSTETGKWRGRGLPAPLAALAASVEPLARHALGYWLAPMLAGIAPFPGKSSLYLRRGFETQRYGRLLLVNQPGAKAYLVRHGFDQRKLVSVRHPLLSREGAALFDRMYGRAEQPTDILVLISYSFAPQGDYKREVADNLVRLTDELAVRHPERRIVLKPHPTMTKEREGPIHEALERLSEQWPNVTVAAPAVNALSLMSRAQIVISTPSAALELARLLGDRIVCAVSFDTPLDEHPLRDPAGVHLCPRVDDLLGRDLPSLSRVDASRGIPVEADTDGVAEVIRRRAMAEAGR